MKARSISAMVVVVVAGCSVRGPYYVGTILEPPAQGTAADDNWVVVVDLDNHEVLGSERVIVGFDGDDLMCEDGGDVEPDGVVFGSPVRFLRIGDDADTSYPPAIRGDDLRVGCS